MKACFTKWFLTGHLKGIPIDVEITVPDYSTLCDYLRQFQQDQIRGVIKTDTATNDEYITMNVRAKMDQLS